MKLSKTWELPAPPKTKEDVWLPVVRLSKWIPFGYEEDPNDPDVLLPIVRELELLEQAKKHLKKYSYREVANWLTKESGKKISNEGLRKRIQRESRRQREATNARLYAERAEKAARKAEEISARYGGLYARERVVPREKG